MIQFVIFDMDGVLVDSERIHYERRNRFFQRHHFHLTKEQLANMVGSNAQAIWQELLPEDTVTREKWFAAYREDVRNNLLDYQAIQDPKMVEFVNWLGRQQIPCALASSAPQQLIDKCLTDIGLAKGFDTILSGEEVSCNKPSPDIYLQTIAKYPTLPKENILVVEDSTIGIQAAKSAGLMVAAKKTPFTEKVAMDQSQADFIFHKPQELIDHFFSR